MPAAAEGVLRERGVEVCLGTSVTEANADGVRLSDGRFVPSRTLVWCVGVRPDPLVEATGLPVTSGRITVDEYIAAPGHPEILACGDAAAVPDPSRPGEITPMTAQHAVRQGRLAADNIAASYGVGRRRPYRHRDLGFVVDLGGVCLPRVRLAGLLRRSAARRERRPLAVGSRHRTVPSLCLGGPSGTTLTRSRIAVERRPPKRAVVRGVRQLFAGGRSSPAHLHR